LSRTNNEDQNNIATTCEEQSKAVSSLDLTPPETQWDEDNMNVLDYIDFESAGDVTGKVVNNEAPSASLGQVGGLNEKATMLNMLASLTDIEGGELLDV
jgi:hypothetical protein